MSKSSGRAAARSGSGWSASARPPPPTVELNGTTVSNATLVQPRAALQKPILAAR
jgi:hypothetical protein